MALELRPNCEYCDIDLPVDSPNARICTYECTFCEHCVDAVLANVCPNCGGGFERRPIRPRNEWRPGLSAVHQPASTKRRRLAYTAADIAAFSGQLRSTPPDQR